MTPEQLQSLLTQADELNKSGNYNEAERLTNQVLAELEKASGSPESVKAKHSPSQGEGVAQSDGVVTLHCSTLLTLANYARRKGDYDMALAHACTSLELAEEHNLPQSIANVQHSIGIVYASIGSYDKALEYSHKALAAYEGLGDKSNVAGVTGNIGLVYKELGSYDKALEYYHKALAVHAELGEKSEVAIVMGNIGIVYKDLGSYNKALEYYHKALAAHEELGEKSGVAGVTGNIGNLYWDIGSYDKALEYSHKARAAHEELGEKSRLATVTGNIGNVFADIGTYDKALEYYNKALADHEEMGEKSGVARVIGNIGIVYQDLGTYDKALEYYLKARAAHEELGNKSGVASVTGNIGSLLAQKKYEGYDTAKAEEYLLKAIAISTEIGYRAALVEFYKTLSALYENENRWEEAHEHYKKYIEVKEEVNVEEVKKQNEQREREKQIAIAIAAADARHQATQELLHNVLPPSIAHRMVEGEKLIAEKLPSVSVLFADIVGFTKLSQRITAEELVEGLDRIFSSFDTLAEKHGLEKIKTIGDAYMVVSGAPEARTDHAEAMAEFALDMVEAMKEFTSKTTGEKIQLRIGIHSGEVVAGVIGKKKFAYDLWGDAVNTASRMESHGEPGKIHVSEDFARNLTQTLSQREGFSESESSLSSSFPFGEGRDGVLVERGEMHIKGKDMMKTYFLESKK